MTRTLSEGHPATSDPVYHPVVAIVDFPDDGKYAAQVAGWSVVIAKVEAGYVAYNDRCTHAASMVSGGRVRRGAIMCPLHGARFDLSTGECLGGPYPALRRFAVRVADGVIEVAVPATAPGMEDMPVRIS